MNRALSFFWRIALFACLSLFAATASYALAGDISGTLPAGVYVTTGPLTVPLGQTLVLEPGVILKMGGGLGFNVYGRLVSQGTPQNPVYLTSLSDDSIGGDTGNNGPTTGFPGGWVGVIIESPASADSQLQNLVIRYAGGSVNEASLHIINSSVTVQNCHISFSRFDAIRVNGSDHAPLIVGTTIQFNSRFGIRANEAASPVRIRDNVISENNSWAMVLTGGAGEISGNTFDNNAGGISFQEPTGSPVITRNTFRRTRSTMLWVEPNVFLRDGGGNIVEASNVLPGISLAPGNWTTSGVWGITSLPYIIEDGDVVLLSQSSITLSPGVVIKFTGRSYPFPRLHIEGTFTAVGISSNPITFTSIRDDSVGGNTNVWEGDIQPAPGDWSFIYIDGLTSTSRLEHLRVRYAGSGNENTALFLYRSSATLRYSEISYSRGNALRLEEGSPTILNNNFHHNIDFSILNVSNALSEIHDNNFQDNSYHGGIQNLNATISLNAQNNYWGHPSGPSGVGPGTGESVSTFVNFIPFRSSPVVIGDETPTPSTSTIPVTTLSFFGPFVVTPSSQTVISTSTRVGFSVDSFGSGLEATRYRLQPNEPFTVFTTSFSLLPGMNTIEAYSTSQQGGIEELRSFVVWVDTAPPVAQITFSPEGLVQSDGPVLMTTNTLVAIAAQDVLAGMGPMLYRLATSSAPITYTGPFALSVGTHSLQVLLFDRVVNVRPIGPISVIVSSVPLTAAGADQPSGGILTDGTPIAAGPEPITAIPPGGGTTSPTGPPVVQSVQFSPAPPLSISPTSLTIRFSKPMNNTGLPQVTLTHPLAAVIPINLQSYVGDTWTGQVQLPSTYPDGTATLVVRNARDIEGTVIPQSVYSVPLRIDRPNPPVGLAVHQNAETGGLELAWQAGSGLAPANYTLYHSTTGTLASLRPRLREITSRSASDLPSVNDPIAYYAVTAIHSSGLESGFSSLVSAALPLAPVIAQPANNARVDVSSIVIRGFAQPGASVSLSTGTGPTLLTAVADSSGTWTASLNLSVGSFLIQAQARSVSTGQVSSFTVVNITAVVLPIPPANFAATPGDTVITLAWTANAQADVVGYNIYRNGSTRPLNVTPLPVTQTRYVDLALTNGRSYSYVIKSVGNDGVESGPSTIQGIPIGMEGWEN